ncbi:MAG: lipoyl synthase [Desulfamplus sp.]|nr:lipoyl synthase [Desulfamplus sp.]
MDRTLQTRQQKPAWLKRALPKTGSGYEKVRELLRKSDLHTVCQEAKCPNMWECFSKHTSTFMIMGDLCTRNCRFCNVKSGSPLPLDPDEPLRVAKAAYALGLKYVVITSVTRDDLEDGGAPHFAKTIQEIKNLIKKTDKEEKCEIEETDKEERGEIEKTDKKEKCEIEKKIKVEVLIPDFQGDFDALNTVMEAKPDVLNHNIETVPSLYPTVRPEAKYHRSLELLKKASNYKASSPVISNTNSPSDISDRDRVNTNKVNIIPVKLNMMPVKSGIMVGLGEREQELKETIIDLYQNGCKILTIGQYLQPSAKHLPVVKFYSPEEFDQLKEFAVSVGFTSVASAPFVRSSYEAEKLGRTAL